MSETARENLRDAVDAWERAGVDEARPLLYAEVVKAVRSGLTPAEVAGLTGIPVGQVEALTS